ncbi:MAG: transposase family protein [Edaphobacter sp.]|nr:transposase family protein [Edaphobacter sp.]
MQIRSVGIDLGKTTFHLVALSAAGKVLLRKKFTQKQLLTFTANLQTSLIGLEACSGAHFLGRALREQGHDVKLIPAQFVKPFVKSNKNDFLDAEAIAEAVDRQNMRFVPIKTADNLTCRRPTPTNSPVMTSSSSIARCGAGDWPTEPYLIAT